MNNIISPQEGNFSSLFYSSVPAMENDLRNHDPCMVSYDVRLVFMYLLRFRDSLFLSLTARVFVCYCLAALR